MNTLRGRLLGSYVVLVGLCLSIIALALFFILRNNPLPDRQSYQRLSDIARASQIAPGRLREGEALYARLAEIAEANDIRTLAVAPDNTVLFDSEAQFDPDSQIRLDTPPGGPGGIEGRFVDPAGQQWLFLSLGQQGPRRGPQFGQRQGEGPQSSEEISVLLATPRRALPAFAILGVNLLRPLVQAGLIACFVSIILAAVISASVARPLQRISEAARALARGDYDHRAPEGGPVEVRRVARTFNEMSAQVKQSQETQRDFLANVSHELKTPLTSIQGFSQAILDGAETNPANAARIIHDEAGRMRRMVEELLDLARIESGQVVMARQHIDLTAILNAVAEWLSLRAAERDVRPDVEVPQLPGMTGDGDRLAQVFTNLIDNALDHTPSGGVVRVGAAHGDSRVRVTVADSGPGIPARDLSRIFERFYQVDKSRARTPNSSPHGAGLGLTITKEIVEAHGGVIRAESAEGQGAIFSVWLPLPRPGDETVVRPR